MNIDLSVPIWTIERVAAALHLSVDAAHEYTYKPGFPAAMAGFARNLWLREDVLAWFAGPPTRSAASEETRPASTGTVARDALKRTRPPATLGGETRSTTVLLSRTGWHPPGQGLPSEVPMSRVRTPPLEVILGAFKILTKRISVTRGKGIH